MASRNRWAPLLSLVAVSLAGCDAEPAFAPDPGARSIPFETIESGTSSGYDAARSEPLPDVTAFAFRGSAQWREFWSLHRSNVRPAPPAPDVDFTRSAVIAVVDRVEATGGFAVEVREVGKPSGDASDVVVRIRKTSPGAQCGVWLALSQPFHFVAVPRFEGRVVPEVTRVVDDCPSGEGAGKP